ncbi:TonB-dependent receptor [Sphingomonas suaedae]|uniref:TonB-dependent receptor n=1 Tax=Sphingomonas suaedae TaxID=2599297 RepID=A0A518RJR6_9SPHN|nr:TonB-dependent receptor [Sphingomonas suaedae]QDX27682.1 TonB-dependent receptor [Sphingomonas suaedae]
MTKPRPNSYRRAISGLTSTASLAVALAFGTPAFAQEADVPVEAANEAEAPGEITITGTRISGFTAPTPVTTVSKLELQDKGVRNLADLISDIPALKANQNTGTSSQPIGASNLDLRGLGPNRTLLLVDGRRFAATDPSGGVDINVIPVGLIRRIDIVTGGASAAYGSDAVSGVVNVVLDDRFEGFKGDVQYGVSTYGDVETPGASLTAGRAFVDGRLHIVASADYFRNGGQLAQESRPWARGDYAVLTNPAYPGTPGAPRQLILPNARFSQMTFSGVTARNSIAALRGIQFGPGGTVLPFNYGTTVGNVYMSGGDGASLAATSNILPVLERMSGYGRITFDVSDTISIYADALVSRADIFSDGTTATDNGNLVIRRDNAFLPSPIRDILIANNLNDFRIGRVAGEDGAFTNSVDNTVQRYGFGIDGKIGASWKWNAFVQLSRNDYYREDGNNRNEDRWLLGIDSVINPATGQPICRALLNNPNPTAAQDPYGNIRACIPINPFGAGSISQAALDYYKGTAVMMARQRQDVYAVSLEGSVFDTWAGTVSLAVGAEYRSETVRADVDDVSVRRRWKTVNPQPLSGELDVKEAFAEVVVPLLRDSGLGKHLDINGAVRVTDYSTSGSVTTWKIGANYTPFDDLRLRATYSRDIRAANINELFSGQSQFFNNITNPDTNLVRNTLQLTGGNPNLTPERAKALTAGAVYQPSWAPGLRLAVDYYSIDLNNAITSLTGQQIVDGCLIRDQADLCSAITFNGNVIEAVEATLINAAGAKSSGVDIEASYSMPVGGGRLETRALVNYVEELSITVNGETTDYAGQTGTTGTIGPAGGIPKWRGILSTTYRDDRASVGVAVRYVGGGLLNVSFEEGVDIDDNDVPARAYVDLNASYRITPNVQIFGSIDNLLNQKPPLTPNAITAPSYASSVFYDRVGRFMTVGARFSF